MTYPLGRREAPDENDAHYPLAQLLQADIVMPAYRYWTGWRTHLSQTGSSCVANAWTHLLTDSPRSHRSIDLDAGVSRWEESIRPALLGYVSVQSRETGFRGWLYDQAQMIDEFADTPPSGGTSVRAGAKVLQGLGAVSAYHWAQNMSDVCTAVLTAGPLVVGTRWYERMFTPEGSDAMLLMGGSMVGGHAWKVDGYNSTTRIFRMKNSWGAGWGINSYAHLSYDTLNALLFGFGDGEACMPVEA